jgi:hypothetical protein
VKTSQLSVDFLIVLIFLLCECKFLWSVCCGNRLSLWRFAVRQCKTDFKSHFLRSFFPGCQTLCWQNQMDFCFLSEFWEISSDTHIRSIFCVDELVIFEKNNFRQSSVALDLFKLFPPTFHSKVDMPWKHLSHMIRRDFSYPCVFGWVPSIFFQEK